jgi:hypothetical protein
MPVAVKIEWNENGSAGPPFLQNSPVATAGPSFDHSGSETI